MNQKGFVKIVFVVITVILVVLIGYRFIVTKEDSHRYSVSETPFLYPIWVYIGYLDFLSDWRPITNYYTNQAVEKKDLRVCDERFADDQSALYRCYWHVAREKEDVSICARIKSENISGNIRYNEYSESCYIDIARTTENFSLCDTLENKDNKTYCYDGIWRKKARDSKNPELCENIKTDVLKINCYELVRND